MSVPIVLRCCKSYFFCILQYSGFDRGHLAPAANHRLNQAICDETFLMSNMSPQVGAGFNRDKWEHLERYNLMNIGYLPHGTCLKSNNSGFFGHSEKNSRPKKLKLKKNSCKTFKNSIFCQLESFFLQKANDLRNRFCTKTCPS